MNNQIIHICLIGCGRAGMIHARNYKNKVANAAITAVADASEDAVKAAAEELGITKYFTDYHDILHDTDIDAVVVVAPTNLHRQIVIDCANAGKHIFCEKPMAMNTQECDEMIEACEKNHVKLQIGFMRRFDSSFAKPNASLTKEKSANLSKFIRVPAARASRSPGCMTLRNQTAFSPKSTAMISIRCAG